MAGWNCAETWKFYIKMLICQKKSEYVNLTVDHSSEGQSEERPLSDGVCGSSKEICAIIGGETKSGGHVYIQDYTI